MPARHLSSVLLPLPLRPTIPRNSPRGTSRLTSSSAWIRSARAPGRCGNGNALLTWSTETAGTRAAVRHRARLLGRDRVHPEKLSEFPVADVTSQLACGVLSLGAEPGLEAAVRSLLDQVPRPEIVVVNSGGGDPEARLRSSGLDVQVVDVDRRLLPGGARNLAIDHTTAPLRGVPRRRLRGASRGGWRAGCAPTGRGRWRWRASWRSSGRPPAASAQLICCCTTGGPRTRPPGSGSSTACRTRDRCSAAAGASARTCARARTRTSTNGWGLATRSPGRPTCARSIATRPPPGSCSRTSTRAARGARSRSPSWRPAGCGGP